MQICGAFCRQEQPDGEPENRIHPVVPECSEANLVEGCLPAHAVGKPAAVAARQPYTANFKGRQWPLQTGQLVTTSADLGLNLCDREGKPCSRHAVDRMLDVFEREGMISRSGEKRKGSVITITNYAEYAQKMDGRIFTRAYHPREAEQAHNGTRIRMVLPANGAHFPAFPENHEQQGNNKQYKILKDLRPRILANPLTHV
jgi:hypothetical protein